MNNKKISLQKIKNNILNWLTKPKRYRNLFRTIKRIKPKTLLEIGVWHGDRAEQMIRAMSKHHPLSLIHYYGFDLFEDLTHEQLKTEFSKMPLPMKDVQEKLEKTGAHIHLFKGNTHETLPREIKHIPHIDFIYIDGGHHPDTIAHDWKYALQRMHQNTVVIFDDLWQNRDDAGCKSVIEKIDRTQYNVAVLKPQDIFDDSNFGKRHINFVQVTLK